MKAEGGRRDWAKPAVEEKKLQTMKKIPAPFPEVVPQWGLR